MVEDQSAGSQTGRMEIVDGLCGICSQILNNLDVFIQKPDSLDEEPSFSHHNSIRELRKSAKDGCSLCALFISDANHNSHQYYSIPAKDVEIDEGDSKANERGPKVIEGGLHEVDIQDFKSSSSNVDSSYANQGTTGGISFRIYQAKYTPQGHLTWVTRDVNDSVIVSTIVLSPVSHPDEHDPAPSNNNPPRDELVLLAKKWIEDCNDRHECFHASHDHKLPTRLLHIDRLNSQLRLSGNLPSNTRYATLSHCWGSGENLKLTKSTLQSFKSKIPHDGLCKTFQDALFITSKLGLEYLWIDSLCIIQDDLDDWRQESALMSTVYGNSYLNIAVAGASDGSQGCFFENEPMRINKLQVATSKGGKKNSMTVHQRAFIVIVFQAHLCVVCPFEILLLDEDRTSSQ